MGEPHTVADMEASDGEARKLSTVGRYVILESIGIGGMGVVCAAYDPKLDRRVALKLLRATGSGQATQTARDRLFREAQALAKLQHPNVVTVHDVGDFEGQVYIAMEFVEGTTLREWLRERPRDWRDILAKFVEAGRGLAAAHAAGIVHRDFKPANVLISHKGDVRVADFGVAKERDRSGRSDRDIVGLRRDTDSNDGLETTGEDALIEEMATSADKQLTVAGRMVGTPAYMAPEQLMGLKVGPFTDQFSFCVCLYEALFGRLPFEGSDRVERLRKMTEGRLPPVPKDDRARAVPAWLYKVVAQGLRPHATERWASMEQLLVALQRDPAKRVRRAALVGLALLGLSVGALGFFYGGRAVEPAPLCQGVDAPIDELWNDPRRAELRGDFEATKVAYAGDSAQSVVVRLDAWAEQWRAQRQAVCEATRVTGEQSEQLLDLRMHCLDRRLQEFGALLDVFAAPDPEIVKRSIGAAHALSDVAGCASIRDAGEFNGENDDPDMRERLDALASEISRAGVLKSAAGKFEESLPILRSVVAQARDLESKVMLAQGLYELAEAQAETDDAAGAEASLREAVVLAASLGDADREARIWTRLMFQVGYDQHRWAEANAWALAADAAIVRAGDRPELRARLEGSLGALRFDQGEVQAAIDHYSRSFQAARRSLGEQHPYTIRALRNYGIALGRMERDAEAEAVLADALARARGLFGDAHPEVGSSYFSYANVLQHAKKFAEGEQAVRAALAVAEADAGPESLKVGQMLNTLALIERNSNRSEAALATFERATAIFTAHDPESVDAAVGHTNVGRQLARLGRLDEALAAFDRAQAVYAKLYPAPHSRYFYLAQYRCRALVDNALVDNAVWSEAERACASAMTTFEQLGERVKEADLPDLLDDLAEIDAHHGRSVAAVTLRERAEAIRREHGLPPPDPRPTFGKSPK
jgi:tRNA A-37 threonylcarbamoyl transferase component Bud32/tetratricopeptide (TPR) repeat protein